MNTINLLKKINFLIKSKKLNTIVCADSYGGIHHLFFILEKLIKENDNILIICAHKEVYKFLKNIKKLNQSNIYFEHYQYSGYKLVNYIKLLPFFLLKPFFKNIKNFYGYKITTDPIRFLILNIFSSKNSKIIIRDQFIKYYTNKKPNILKIIILRIVNTIFSIKLDLYYHRDLTEELFPCINYNFNKKIVSEYNWKNINNFFFQKKKNFLKNSLLIIDDTIQLLEKMNYIDFNNSKEIFDKEIENFILKKNIDKIFLKKHPTSKRSSYLAKSIKDKKINIISDSLPIEIDLENYEYCLFSSTSSIYFKTKIKLYNVSKLLIFKNKIYKENYFYLLNKVSNYNIKKIKFI